MGVTVVLFGVVTYYFSLIDVILSARVRLMITHECYKCFLELGILLLERFFPVKIVFIRVCSFYSILFHNTLTHTHCSIEVCEH